MDRLLNRLRPNRETPMSFADKVVIVTGGAGGIGRATALAFAAVGAHVVVADLELKGAEEVVSAIDQAGFPKAIARQCDVSDESSVTATVDDTVSVFGRLDVIVNNAGLMVFKGIDELVEDDWRKVLDVDLMGAFYFTKQAFLKMKNGGAIVNISSVHAVETSPFVAPYAAAKSALLSLTRSAALEGTPKNIRVNAILPGAIDTPMLWDNPNVKAGIEWIDKSHVGRPEDIADAVVFLASDKARFIQGSMLLADGGRLDQL
jgi:meso-butanediol dehydrogenase/(S,S)-butanediol dehydrogenase/diacetyl reductase